MNRVEIAPARRVTRTAECGHEVRTHGGPQRKRCDACAWPPRSCRACPADLTRARRTKLYCSTRCKDEWHGRVRTVPLPQRSCALPECGVMFTPGQTWQRCCSERHGHALWNRESRADGRQPAGPWNDLRRNNYHARRARPGGRTGDRVLLAEVAARDGFVCGWCGLPVDLAVPWPDRMSKSLDHIVPLSKGGGHELGNVQLMHLGCNSSKGARA